MVLTLCLATLQLITQADAQTTHTITNGDVTVGININWGAAITRLDYRVGSVIAINNVDNSGGPGRQIEAAIYDAESSSGDCWPAIGSGASCTSNPQCPWKWNPVQAGSACGIGSPAIVLTQTPQRIVTRTFAVQWNQFWTPVPQPSSVVIEQDLEIISSHLVRVSYTVTNNETFVVNGGHELPVVYLQDQYNVAVHYDGASPGTSDPAITQRTFSSGDKSNPTTTTEPWIGFVQQPQSPPHSQPCSLLNCPAVLLYVHGVSSGWNIGRMEDAASLMQAWQDVTFQPGEARVVTAYLAVGTLAEARQAAYDAPIDIFGTIQPNGSPVQMTFTTIGQQARLAFEGVAGQRVSVRGTRQSGWYLFHPLAVLNPDGTTLASTSYAYDAFVEPVVLPSTGTYTILIDPYGSELGTVTTWLYDVVDFTGSIAVDGAGASVPLGTPGMKAMLTFEGTLGQRVSAVGTRQSGWYLFVPLAILKPDGATLSSVGYAYDVFLEPATLPVSGTYSVLVDPYGAESGAVTTTLHSVNDVNGTIVVGGAAVTVSLPTPGQVASLTMAGTSGQSVTVRLAGNSIGYVTVRLLKPDGTELTSKLEWWPSFDLSTVTLPATGNYTVVVDPYSASAGGITVTVTNP